MRKELKFVALFYLGVIVFAYAFTFKTDKLSTSSERENQNRSLVIKLR